MKKIALLLTIALAFTSIATAADVVVGGWIDVQGGIKALSGDVYEDADRDEATIYNGSNEFEVSASVTGDNFGGRIGLIHWSGRNGQWEDEGVAAAPYLHNSYVYSDFVPGKVRVYGGIQMFPFGNYTSYAAVDGADFGEDQFGLGFGAFNYASNPGVSKKPTGLALELKPVDNLAIISILDIENFTNNANNDETINLGDELLKDGTMHMAVKYNHEMVDVFAGTHLKYSATERSNFWVEANIKAVDKLTAALKYEMDGKEESDDVVNAISANLGYDLGMLRIASEIVQEFQGGDTAEATTITVDGEPVFVPGRWTSRTTLGFSIKPVVPVVNFIAKARVTLSDEDEGETTWAVGGTVSKAFGQANNNLGLRYVHEDEDKNKFVVDYKITLWF